MINTNIGIQYNILCPFSIGNISNFNNYNLLNIIQLHYGF